MESEPQVDNLKSLFQKGIESIGTQRHDNIFQDLETRALTTTEQDIINQRVALQRRLFEEYEKREQARKVAELREVCPDLSDVAALKALELCGGREDDAAEELVSNPSFRARVMQAVASVVLVSSKPNASSGSGGGETEQRPKPLDLTTTTVHAEVFVGAFRGKGYPTTGAPKVSLSLLRKQNIELGPPQEDPDGFKGSDRGAPLDMRCAVDGDQQQQADGSGRTEPYPESPRNDTAVEEAGTKTPDPVPCASPSSTALRRASSESAGSRSAHSAAVPYGLAVESQGRLRPAHDAEVEAATLSRTILSLPENDDEDNRSNGAPKVSSESDDKQDDVKDEGSGGALEEIKDDQSEGHLGGLAAAEDQVPQMRHPRAAKAAALACFFLADEEDDRQHKSSDDEEDEESLNGLEKGRLGSRARKASSGDAHSHSSDDERPCAKRPRPSIAPVSEGETGSASQGGNDSETTLTDGEPPSRSRRRSSRRAAGRRDIVNDDSNASSRAHNNNSSLPTGVLPTSQSLPPLRRYGGVQAVSATGHTNRGRVKQKSHKSAELVYAGELRAVRGWYNSGYIFPLGFVSRTLFRSSVALDQLCVHDCYVLGEGGEFWPAPTFRVVARDRPDEPLTAKSCTGCWTAVLKRINGEIETRRAAGENLPPPPKTAIAGPEYFGFNQVNIQEAVEALDPGRLCVEYWAGKEQRLRAAAGLPAIIPSGPSSKAGGGDHSSSRGRANRKRGGMTNNSDDAGSEEDDSAAYASRWSTINRSERYRKRREDAGDDVAAIDEDNPLPELLDPITLEPVVRPAISPYGHVMGMATWKAVLAEKSCCPFTKQPLTWEQCKVLTKNNIHLYNDRIIK